MAVSKRMIKVIWTDRMRIDEVITKVVEERKLLKLVRKRKTSLLVHVMRRKRLHLRITEGKEGLKYLTTSGTEGVIDKRRRIRRSEKDGSTQLKPPVRQFY